jgi:hypothetical protein
MATKDKKQITTMREMERALGKVAGEVLADQNLTLRAAVNPVLAMEELGYTFPADLRASIDRRIRFHPQIYERMESLAGEIRRIAGRSINPDSAADLDRFLFDGLRLARPPVAGREHAGATTEPENVPERSSRAQQRAARAPAAPQREKPSPKPEYISERVPPQLKWAPKVIDPLEQLRGAHPVMEALLEYRRLDASEPRLATPEIYEMVRRGEARTGVKVRKISVLIKPHQHPEH